MDRRDRFLGLGGFLKAPQIRWINETGFSDYAMFGLAGWELISQMFKRDWFLEIVGWGLNSQMIARDGFLGIDGWELISQTIARDSFLGIDGWDRVSQIRIGQEGTPRMMVETVFI